MILSKIRNIIQYLFFIITRYFNQKHRYDYPPENNGWKKYGVTPVYGDKETNSVFDPFVLAINEKLFMYLSERNFNNIVRIESQDGIKWSNSKIVLKCIPQSWQMKVNRSCLVIKDNIWHMWYTGQTANVSCIGHSVSMDGLHFKNASIPCIKAEMPLEGISVMNPCVIWNAKKNIFQMWYAAGENYEPDMLFYAESNDGEIWIKNPNPILTKHSHHKWEKIKVGGCDVKLNDDGHYYMYYIGYQNLNVARICFATSIDGIHWERPDNNYILSPTPKQFDSDSVYKPTIVCFKNQEYLWYNGRNNNNEYIGLAINSNEKDASLFKRG